VAAQTPRSPLVVPLSIAVHAASRRRRIVPPSPTANTSVASTTATARSDCVLCDGSVHHCPAGHVAIAPSPRASAVTPSSPASTPPSAGGLPHAATTASRIREPRTVDQVGVTNVVMT
jgi:hypothetical protein